MGIQVVAFDLDGTLYPNTPMYLKSFFFAVRNLRLLRAFARVRKQLRATMDAALKEPGQASRSALEIFRLLQAKELARLLKLDEGVAFGLIERKIYGEWTGVLKKVRPFPHLKETLRLLVDRGLRLALVSDFPIGDKLRHLGLDATWDFMMCSEDTGYLKPHPAPFRALIAHFGVPAEDILYVGNSYAYDILGAKAAGCRTAHLSRWQKRNGVADLTFYHYNDLAAWLTAG